MEYTITSRITNEERETHLWFDYVNNCWTMDSTVSKHFNKAIKQGWELKHKTIYEDGTTAGMILTAPANAISIRNPSSKRVLTEEQKRQISERLQSSRNSIK